MATSIVKAVIGSNASKKAASQQAAAAAEASRIEGEKTGEATALQKEQYDRARADLLANQATQNANYQPYLTTGTAANNQLGYALGLGGTGTGEAGSLAKAFTMADYEADPGYAFRLAEGQKALDRVTAAKGKYYSGGAIKGLTDYNQGMASQEYSNAYDRYRNNQSDLYSRLKGTSDTGFNAATGMANVGANTQQALNSAGMNYANQSGSYLTGLGTQQGENAIGAGNARAAGTIGQGQAWVTGIDDIKKDAAFAAGMSDERLKENIKKVDVKNGFNIYEFNYKNKPERYRGVMAQEVQDIRPDAIFIRDGYLGVHYDKLGLEMERI